MLKLLISAIVVASLTGCASIVSGTSQSVTVETHQGPQMVQGANCKLENSKGQWYSQAPGSVVIHRAYGPLTVTCDKEGLPTGVASFESSTIGMAAGNILFGGVVGIGVDAASGAAYEYPSLMKIEMGQTLNFTKAAYQPTTYPRNPTAEATPQPPAPTVPSTPIAAAPARTVIDQTPPGEARVTTIVPAQPSAAPKPTLVSAEGTYVTDLKNPEHKYQMAAEQLAKDISCSPAPVGSLKMAGPGFEIYSIQCSSGDKDLVRCDIGTQCHVMQ
jgi:uncharacterized protein YceK